MIFDCTIVGQGDGTIMKGYKISASKLGNMIWTLEARCVSQSPVLFGIGLFCLEIDDGTTDLLWRHGAGL